MPRKRQSGPPIPTCPLCGASNVEVVGHEGQDNQLTLLRCAACGRTWSELLVEERIREEDL